MGNYLTKTIQGVIYTTWPMILITIIVLVLLRTGYIIKNKINFSIYKEILMLSFIIYILSLFQVVTLQDTVSYSTNNFLPFKEIMRYEFGSRLFTKNVIGNIILFLPFGFFIGYILRPKKIYSVLLILIITSASIEIIQLVIGRVFDVDDILLNLIGGIIGYFIFVILDKVYKSLPSFLTRNIVKDILSIIILILLIYLIFIK